MVVHISLGLDPWSKAGRGPNDPGPGGDQSLLGKEAVGKQRKVFKMAMKVITREKSKEHYERMGQRTVLVLFRR